jgi:hypothetical protein
MCSAPEAERRALDMAAWELEVQDDAGAIHDLLGGGPRIFDTGQVLFGLLAAYQASGAARFVAAAQRAAAWLVGAMQPDGSWRRGEGHRGGRAFHARVAWALAELGSETGEERWRAAARRALEWTLAQETHPAWFAHNCLTDDRRPLLHTIVYTARGLFEGARLLGAAGPREAARRTARVLAECVGEGGWLSGRFDPHWRGSVRWACLTGMAQAVVLWSRLYAAEGDELFARRAESVLGFLKRTHDLDSRDPGMRGGMRGSFPIQGAYCPWRLPNWATKFFIDALLFDPRTKRQPRFMG